MVLRTIAGPHDVPASRPGPHPHRGGSHRPRSCTPSAQAGAVETEEDGKKKGKKSKKEAKEAKAAPQEAAPPPPPAPVVPQVDVMLQDIEKQFADHAYLKKIKTLQRQHDEAMAMKQKIVFGTVCPGRGGFEGGGGSEAQQKFVYLKSASIFQPL